MGSHDPIASQPIRSDGRFKLVSPSELVNTPSRLDGISPDEECRLRSSACTFIAKAGKELQFKQLAMATACVYLHTFFCRFSFKSYDKYDMASVCLFLAGKVEEQRRKVRDIAEICYKLRYKKRLSVDTNNLKQICDSYLDKELLLLSVIEFNFHPQHPYHYCMTILKKLFQQLECAPASPSSAASVSIPKLVQKEIAQCAWLMINDSLKTTVCVQYAPEPIALACIDAAIRIHNLDCPASAHINIPPEWFTAHLSTMTSEICHHIWAMLRQVVIELDNQTHTGDVKTTWDKFRIICDLVNGPTVEEIKDGDVDVDVEIDVTREIAQHSDEHVHVHIHAHAHASHNEQETAEPDRKKIRTE